MIQAEPKRYRLEGQDKLRVIAELPDTPSRVLVLQDLLATLGAREAA